MRAIAILVLSCWALGCSCRPETPPSGGSAQLDGGGSANGGSNAQQGERMPAITYEGPELRVEVETQESAPPRHVLVVDAHVPTGGFELAHDETRVREGRTEVLLTLTHPGRDDIVTQAFEHERVRVPLEAGAPTPVHVLVAQPQRGVHYVQAPPHELATVVKVPSGPAKAYGDPGAAEQPKEPGRGERERERER